MKKKPILTTLILIFSLHFAIAQAQLLENIKTVSLQNIEAIIENDEVKGYLTFYSIDKKNSKEDNYKLLIYDNNLTKKYDINIVKSRTSFLMESAYNGEAFCYSFIDTKSKSLSYSVYNKEGKLAGTNTVTDISKWEYNALLQKTQAENSEFFGGLSSVPSKGFVRFNLDSDKGRTSIITLFDNKGAKIWAKTIKGDDANDYVNASPLATDKSYIATIVYTRESLMSQKIKKWHLIVYNTSDGSEAFKLDLKGTKHQWGINGLSFEGNDIYVYGEYFSPEANSFKDESDGIFMLKLDQKGKILNESYSSWEKEIKAVASEATITEKGKRTKLAIHKVIRTNEGKLFVIGEQFKSTVDAIGVAGNVVGGGYGNSMTKIALYNMVILEFDENLKIIKGKVINKSKTIVSLIPGLEFYGNVMIANYLKSTGQFDYSFTTVSPDHSTFSASYVNYDREKESKNNIIGTITYTKEKVFKTDAVKILDNPTSFVALPGKPGYIGIFKYFKKQKNISFKLEKLNL